jgi:GntR family transcriptional regulator, transcriptional repressor for pyruvate dehydrogenase complex
VREARRLLGQSSRIGLQGTLGGYVHKAIEEHAATLHIDNTLEDYQREIQRRVFG